MKINVNKNAGAYASGSRIIEKPIEYLYQRLAGISSWPNWRQGIQEVRLIDVDKKCPRFVWKSGGFRYYSQVHTSDGLNEFGWTGRIAWIRAVHNWSFTRVGKSKTIVRIEESLEGFGSTLFKTKLPLLITKDLDDISRNSP